MKVTVDVTPAQAADIAEALDHCAKEIFDDEGATAAVLRKTARAFAPNGVRALREGNEVKRVDPW